MEPLLHFAIPASILLLQGRRMHWALLAGLAGMLPDFDIFFMAHRSISHSLLIASLPLLASLLKWKKNSIRLPLIAASFGWMLHVVLDFIGGPTPIAWPILSSSYGLLFEANIHAKSFPIIELEAILLEEAYDYGFFESLDAPIFTAEGLAVSIILLALAFLRSR